MRIDVLRLDPALALPSPAREHDAGLDLHARHDVCVQAGGGRALVATGFALAIPPGWAGFVLPRSGLAARHGVTCLNAPGLIDSGYRDEVKVLLLNTDPAQDYQVRRGDRIAQLVVMAVEDVSWSMVGELSASERGTGGLGHSGR